MKMGNSSKFTLLAVLIFVLAILSAVNFGNTGEVFGQRNNSGAGDGQFDDDNLPPKTNPPGGGPVTYATYELCGYAWGGVDETSPFTGPAMGGVGWVSFNSKNTGSGPSYAVYAERDPNSSRVARLKGYAWSPNIGWIKFGDLQEDGSGSNKIGNDGSINCNNGSNNLDCGNSRIVFANRVNFGSGSFLGSGLMFGQNSSFKGWARACAGTTSGDCSSPQSRTDGWDGWISLGPPNINSGNLVVNSGVTTGAAWGSNVVGWLSFGHAQTPGGVNGRVHFCDADSSFNFSVSGGSITLAPDESGSVNVVTSLISGSTAPVTLTVETTPSDISASFAGSPPDPSCTPQSSCSRVLNINVGPDATTGSYDVVVKGESGVSPNTTSRYGTIVVNVVAPTSGGTLSISCEAPLASSNEEGPVPGENKFYVNRPVDWTVNIDSASVPAYRYEAFYNGQPGTAPSDDVSGIQSTEHIFTKTYTTIGVKTFSAEVTDSLGAVGTCDSEQVIIVVNPDFNEK